MVMRIIRVLEQRQSSPRFWATLPFSARRINRGQRFFLDNGEEVEFECPYSSLLVPGQQLETEQGDIVEIIGEEELVSVATLYQNHALLFGRACYILGVFRVPAELGREWLRYPVNKQVDDKLKELGLEVHTEKAVFCPDRDSFLYQTLMEATRNTSSPSTANDYPLSYNIPYGPSAVPFNSSAVGNQYQYQQNYISDPYPPYVQPTPEYVEREYIVQDQYGYDPYNPHLPSRAFSIQKVLIEEQWLPRKLPRSRRMSLWGLQSVRESWCSEWHTYLPLSMTPSST